MSLITKYRPQKLEDVIGQKSVIKAIKSALARKSIPKSWLFTGPAGTGKTTLARILANHVTGGKANLANVIYVDAATDSGAEETRATVGKSHFKAIGESPIKFFICDEAQNFSSKAWDALLIATEEPPAHVFWCFCSTNPSKIPETIKTRCIKFTLKSVDDAELFDLLCSVTEKEKLDTGFEVIEAIAENSNGSPRQALSNLELCAHLKSAGEARELMRSALQMKGPVDLAKLLIKKGYKPKWPEVTKCIQSMENVEAESVRIVINNYVAAIIMSSKSDNEVAHLLNVLSNFSTPYVTSDKLAPLLISIGGVLYSEG